MSLTIHPLDLGRVETDTSFLVWGLTPGRRRIVAVAGYLVLGAGAPIVIDTGYRFGHTEKGFHVFERTPEQSLRAALGAHDVDVADVELLVMTHLHSDHTGEIDALPNARIAVQRRELEYAVHPYHPATMYDRGDVGKLFGPLFDRVDALDGDRELAPGVTAVHTGGHSPGHQQVEVEVDSGLAIVVGDNAYLVEPSVTEQMPPGYVTSIPETMEALAAIRRRAQHVLPMHDLQVFERYPDGVR